jgi:hypothetical protein
MESSVVVLADVSMLRPNLSRPDLVAEFHASVAALLGSGRSTLVAAEARGDALSPLPDLKVVFILLPLSGLGLLETLFAGAAKLDDPEGVMVLADEYDP